MSERKRERNMEIRERVRAGETMEDVGADYGISRQRVHQIVSRRPQGVRTAVPDNRPLPMPTAPAILSCQACGNENVDVIDSRPTYGGTAMRRRRRCPSCGERWTTYEFAGEFIESLTSQREALGKLAEGLMEIMPLAGAVRRPL